MPYRVVVTRELVQSGEIVVMAEDAEDAENKVHKMAESTGSVPIAWTDDSVEVFVEDVFEEET